MSNLKRVLSAVAIGLFGRWHWQAPAWLEWLAAKKTRAWCWLTGHPARAIGAVLMAVSFGAAFSWYVTRPKPHYVTYIVTPPGLTEYNGNGISSIKPLTVVFSESAAPLKDLQKTVTSGIDLAPAVAGAWFWKTDKELQFTPKDDWPVDGAFTVRLARTVVATQDRLDRYSFRFKSEPFTAQITEGQFYQDPRDPNLKKLVATVKFSHPVDAGQLEARISLLAAKDAEYLGLGPDSKHLTVVYDKFKLAAYMHSSALALPRDDTPMTLRIDRGVRAAHGGNETPARLETVVTIPGRASLRFSDARMAVVDNTRYEPEQILMLTSSSPVAERALTGNVSVRLLPERHPKQPKEDRKPFNWRDQGQIDNDILAQSKPLDLAYVASDDAGNTSHGFKFLAPVGRYLYVVVRNNVQGIGGYVSGKPYSATVRVEPYRQALTFLGQGSLLSLSGDRKVGFLVRDVEKVDVEIGRVLPNQLQHLSPQMWNFTRPSLYGDLEDRLVERFTTRRTYTGRAPGKPTYDNIDVGQYLQEKTQHQRGLFLLHVRAVDAPTRTDDEENDGYRNGHARIEDTRLVLVTDLGFIVKQAKDGSRDVFVQSIRTGLPVDGAQVELLGTNGETALTATTDVGGRAQLASADRLRREKTPLAIVVQKDTDVSFMPIRSGDRQLNFSRFDTGGVESASSAQQVSAYLFSDRGIYRPGETAHLGLIARTADWKGALAGLPIIVEITDSRGLIVSRSDIKLSVAGFDEITFASQLTAPTGIYQAVAYLPRNERRRDTLGSTSFKLQEFEPDRMKVRLNLSEKTIEGWLRPDDVKARITVAHLFGEAASNRRVEGELTLTPALPRFSRYPDYRFQIGEAIAEPYQEQLAVATTDANGNAEFKLDLKRFVGRAYRLNLLGRAFEADGGRNVAAQNSAIVSDAPYLVGVKPDGDLSFVQRNAKRDAMWLAVNQQLAPVTAKALTLEWVQRKYVSVLTEQNDKTVKYVSRLKEIVRDSKPVDIASGGSPFALPTGEPGDFALVLRDGSGAELNKLTYAVAGTANLSRSLERDTELQVQLDKPAYSPGDTIEVSIRAPYVGAGLITVERERVFQYQWFKTTTTSSVQKITLPANFEGNGYVNVQFLRDPSSDELFLSPLSYGVAAFAANLSARTETVKLDSPREVKPGAMLTIKVTPHEASRVAVLAVDEGILQVARYKNPDPLGFFFQKRMLEVETRQILDLILPDFKRFLALAAPGGDADGGYTRQLNPFNRKRKPPVAYWSGLMNIGPGGRELQYRVPDYFNGKLRIVAIAASPRHMGVAEAATDVKGDFILTPNVPAMVAPGDEFIVSVGVFNNAAQSSGAIRVEAQPGPELAIVGPSSVDLQIAEKSEGVGEFRVKTKTILGTASLKFIARRSAAQAQVDESISVRPAVAFRTQVTLGRLDGPVATASVTRDLFSERRNVEASVSTLPLVWGQGLTAYLEHYEYSCTEQLVSQGFAALMLTVRPEFGVLRARGAQSPLEATYSVLRGRANDRGGFGLWSASAETAEFATVYAAHLLVEAKDRGQAVPANLLTNVDDWLVQFASTPASTLEGGRLRAYSVYLLVRQGIKPNAALANVEQELAQRYPKAWTTDLAAAYLASTYRLMQRNADADRIFREIPWAVQKRDQTEEIYYDATIHDAQLLYLLARHAPMQLGAAPPTALETISKAVSGKGASSLSAAYALLALDAYAKTTAVSETLAVVEIEKDGTRRDVTMPAGAMPKVAVSEQAARLEFSRQGRSPAYYAISESGFDRSSPATAMSQEIEIYRDFVDAKGNVLPRVTVGDEFFVRIRLRTMKRDRLLQLAIVDLLPGGVEPVLEVKAATGDTSTAGVDPALLRRRQAAKSLPLGLPDRSDWFPAHIDVRDDRVLLYGDASRNVGTFVYRVRASNAGMYQVPPAFVEGMYNRSVTGLSPAGKLEVAKP